MRNSQRSPESYEFICFYNVYKKNERKKLIKGQVPIPQSTRAQAASTATWPWASVWLIIPYQQQLVG